MSDLPLTDAEYERLTEAVLRSIESQVDAWLDADVVDMDQRRTGGLLELECPDRSKLVVNTQPPLQEIWLASRRGGFHFRYTDGAWRDTRDGAEFFSRLSEEASAQCGRALVFRSTES
ncbi:iron donor protein CyaY [Roseateles sp. BYS180W]|uniref:Iron-sulfur cluster assembly protein CyaY n=1 Tax=Roseateles rivi TaxID=3299028 RepID=A0ABW7FRD2_9BURK